MSEQRELNFKECMDILSEIPVAPRGNKELLAQNEELYESHEWLIDAIGKLIAGEPIRDLDERIANALRVSRKIKGREGERDE